MTTSTTKKSPVRSRVVPARRGGARIKPQILNLYASTNPGLKVSRKQIMTGFSVISAVMIFSLCCWTTTASADTTETPPPTMPEGQEKFIPNTMYKIVGHHAIVREGPETSSKRKEKSLRRGDYITVIRKEGRRLELNTGGWCSEFSSPSKKFPRGLQICRAIYVPNEPMESRDNFKIGDRVKIDNKFNRGRTGTVMDESLDLLDYDKKLKRNQCSKCKGKCPVCGMQCDQDGDRPCVCRSEDQCHKCKGTGKAHIYGVEMDYSSHDTPSSGGTRCTADEMTLSRRRLVRKETASQRVMRRLLAGDREPVPLYDSASCE